MTHIPYLQPDVRPDNDCSTRLLIMGIIMIVLGGISGCITLSVVPVSLMMIHSSNVPGLSLRHMIVGMTIYPVIATALIWTGIGSIQKRRWVRPIVLIFATFGLLMGGFALISTCLSIPMLSKAGAMPTATPFMVKTSKTYYVVKTSTTSTTATTAPTTRAVSIPMTMVTPTMTRPIMASMIGGIIFSDLLFGVGLPLMFLLMYRGQHVRTTLEFYDPTWRWTEACPIPVLGLAIATLIAAVTMPLSALVGTMFFFGMRVSGIPLIVVMIVLTVLLIITSGQVYRIKLMGWQTVLGLVCIGAASWITTLFRIPIEEMYRASGIPEQLIHDAPRMNSSTIMTLLAILWTATAIAFVLYIRRFFPGGHQFTVDGNPSTMPAEN